MFLCLGLFVPVFQRCTDHYYACKWPSLTPHSHRAVGWHLFGCKERLDLDCAQWKGHSEVLEQAAEQHRQAWAQKEQEIEAQMKEIQVNDGCNACNCLGMLQFNVHATTRFWSF